jgi:hypothetical protein
MFLTVRKMPNGDMCLWVHPTRNVGESPMVYVEAFKRLRSGKFSVATVSPVTDDRLFWLETQEGHDLVCRILPFCGR